MIAGTAAKGHPSRNSLCNETGIVWHVGCSRGRLLAAMGMTMADRDMLPRTFQANVDRFYQRVILKTLRTCRSEEHTSELQSLMRISYAVFCLKKKKINNTYNKSNTPTLQNTTITYTIKRSTHPHD